MCSHGGDPFILTAEPGSANERETPEGRSHQEGFSGEKMEKEGKTSTRG